MPFTVALVVQPAGTFTLLVGALAGLLYFGYVRSAVVPGLAGVAAALLAALGYAQVPPPIVGLVAVAGGIILMNVEFVLPTFGCAGVAGVAAFASGAWWLLDPAPALVRVALGLAGAGLLLTTIGAALRRITLPH
jgi:membrane-bound serine protease (ClpP class)